MKYILIFLFGLVVSCSAHAVSVSDGFNLWVGKLLFELAVIAGVIIFLFLMAVVSIWLDQRKRRSKS